MQSFSLKDGQIETRLAGQAVVRGDNFIDLLAPERRASIFQSAAADSETNAKLLKALLGFATATNPDVNGGTLSEERAIVAAKEFASGDDPARVYRELYAASRLLQRGLGFQTAYELAEAARTHVEAGMSVPEVTLAVQADEFRPIRSHAIAAGATPDVPEAPRNVLSNLVRGRIEDLSGLALFNQDKLDESVEHLKRAIGVLPEGTPAWRTSLWHLGAALEGQDNKTEALSYYIRSYNSGDPEPVRRAVIEQLYRKINGSLEGLDQQIGPSPVAAVSAQVPASDSPTEKAPENTSTAAASPTPAADASSSPAPSPTVDAPVATVPASETPSPATETATPSATPSSAAPVPAVPESSPESPAPSPEATPEPKSNATPEPTPEASPSATPESTPAPATSLPLDASPVEKMDRPPRTTVTVTGHVKDASGNRLTNVVVVLISAQGTVLASTTDEQGKYSFTVALSSATRSYRIIPSKDGFMFEPIDRVLQSIRDDITQLDFVGTVNTKP